jgi:hypothetical protein
LIDGGAHVALGTFLLLLLHQELRRIQDMRAVAKGDAKAGAAAHGRRASTLSGKAESGLHAAICEALYGA